MLGGSAAYADEVTNKTPQQILASKEGAKEAVIKLFVVSHIVDTLKPWNSYISRTTGSGFIIEGDQINLSIDNIADFDDLMGYASQEGSGVLFDFGDGDELFLSGTQLAALDRDQFSFY